MSIVPERSSSALDRRYLIALGLIVLLAIALRIWWVTYLKVDPRDGRFDDSANYDGFARMLADGKGYINFLTLEPTANWPPAYAGLLAGLYVIFGQELAVARALNVALAGAAVILMYAIGSRMFDRRVGLVGALLLAVLPGYLYFSSLTLAENLFVPAFLVVILLLVSWGFDGIPTASQSIAVGASIALATMVRAEGIWLLLPVIVFWFLASGRRMGGARNCALLLFAVAVVLVPWTVRNAVQMDRFIPVRETSEDTFATGLHPSYRYYGVVLTLDPRDPRAIPRDQLPTLRDDLKIYQDDPLEAFHLVRHKLVDLFDYDHDALDWINSGPHQHLSADEYRTWRAAANAAYYALGVLGLAGLAIAAINGDRRAWLFAGIALTWILGFMPLAPEGRYHMPLLPLAAIYAAALLVSIAPNVRLPNWRASQPARLAGAGAIVIAGVVAIAAASTTAGVEYKPEREAPTFLALGDVAVLGDLDVSARDVSITSSDAAYGPAPAGQTWVIVDISVRNTGTAPILLLGPAQANVEDSERNLYQMAPSDALNTSIGSGQTIDARTAFAVPAGATNLDFVFRATGVATEGRWSLD